MTINTAINSILAILKDNEKIGEFLKQSNNSSILRIGNSQIIEINENSIILLDKEDITRVITPANPTEDNELIDTEKLKNFFNDLGKDLVRLNHLGINFSCRNVKEEVIKYKKLLEGTDFKLYQEESHIPDNYWYFIGNINNWENPIFELVMTESKNPIVTKWIPHFQIDIDTNLNIDQLEVLTKKHLKENFFDWKLDTKWGVALAMGEMGNINGTKIYLGLSTDSIRNPKYHREQMLKEI